MKNYDVIIIGGGTAGCSCAYNCAKLGLKVLIIEKTNCLGGSMTNGLVIPAMETGKNIINNDFYKILISEMKNFGAQITYQNNEGWFNPEILKIVLDKLLKDVGVDILFCTDNFEIYSINNSIKNLLVYIDELYGYNVATHRLNLSQILSEHISARYFVDATGDLNFCKKINCNFLENFYDFPPMSLRFIMGGIDLKVFGDWLLSIDSDRTVTTVEHIDGVTHLSTAYTWDNGKNWALRPYFKDGVNDGRLKDTDINYFQVFSVAGAPNCLAFNCPRIVEKLNPNSKFDVSKALIEARGAIYRLLQFCKDTFPGFSGAYISNIANEIGVRASNRIKGKYIYTIDDLRSGKSFANPVLVSEYPVDVHSCDKNSSRLEKVGQYQLPIESLMSADYDNLFVVGRGISADELAQGALRVQINCFSMGEAVAKWIAKGRCN